MKKNIIWLDYTRVIACVMVVLIHVSAPYVSNYNKISLDNWMVGNIVDSFSRIAIALFFMISGYLFCGEKSPKVTNFIKLSSALVFYSVLGFLTLILASYLFQNKVKIPEFNIFSKPQFYHLWFFYIMIPTYIFLKFIRIESSSLKSLTITFIILFIITNPRTNDITMLFDINSKNYFMIEGMFIHCLMYSVIGGMIRNIDFTPNQSFLLFTIFILSSILTVYLTYIATEKAGRLSSTFYGYSAPLVAIAGVSLFCFMKSLSSKLSDNKVVTFISNYSLGIYGFHALILYITQRYIQFYLKNPFVWIPIIFIIAMSLSILFTFVVKRFDRKGYLA